MSVPVRISMIRYTLSSRLRNRDPQSMKPSMFCSHGSCFTACSETRFPSSCTMDMACTYQDTKELSYSDEPLILDLNLEGFQVGCASKQGRRVAFCSCNRKVFRFRLLQRDSIPLRCMCHCRGSEERTFVGSRLR